MKHHGLSLSILVVALVSAPSRSAADEETLYFETDVRPILKTHCFHCHGERGEREGGLDIRLARLIQHGGDSGPAIEPSLPADSLLIDRLELGEMPPDEAKQISPEELETIRLWIEQGAKTLRAEPETIDDSATITFEDRQFWSFQPITKYSPPDVNSSDRIRTPIDQFILAKLEANELTFAADADRLTLIQRVSHDLTGLPPTQEQIDRFLTDTSEQAYESMVDRMLASPHYGERWARHWLDAAGYSDSEGYDRDVDRPWAFRYRDWVINSFNNNKPYDQFVIEQLAGDELVSRPLGDLTDDEIDLLTATGFLRMAADGTGSGQNDEAGRNQVIADTIEIVGTSLLGMSVQCARCHDHRYDPISQADYYQLRAIFEPTLDWKSWKQPRQRLISLYTEEDRKRASEIDQEAQAVQAEKNARQAELIHEAATKELEKFAEPLQTQLREAFETPTNKRSEEQTQLLKQNPSVNISPGVLYQYNPAGAEELKQFDARIAEVRKRKPAEAFVRAAIEPESHLPTTHVFHRGDWRQPLEEVNPMPLSIAMPATHQASDSIHPVPNNLDDIPTSGRRLSYARWLSKSNHPLFARVIVNRVWLNHFGRGLVSTPGDFGKLGEAPTHPEMLDWLAVHFRETEWNIKELHRLILKSTVYRQASRDVEHGLEKDPLNGLYWRWPVQRLDAESLRDAILLVSGQLNPTLFGAPIPLTQDDAGQILVAPNQHRRSIYVRVKRTQPVAVLQLFDQPSMLTNCVRRVHSTAAPQSLLLLNSQFIIDQAAALALQLKDPKLSEQESAFAERMPEGTWLEGGTWKLGYGRLSTDAERVETFTEYPHVTASFHQGGPERPDPTTGWSMLTASGGHPGTSPEFSAIRRWVAKRSGTLKVDGNLKHSSDQGDGVQASLVSSRGGRLGQWPVFNEGQRTKVEGIEVQAGDIIDFVTDCRGNTGYDSFEWSVVLTLENDAENIRTSWHSNDALKDVESAPAMVQVQRAWHRVLQREPNEDELKLAYDFLRHQCQVQAEQDAGQKLSHLDQAMVNLCQMLLSSNEFLYLE